jgi:GDP-4-dehydro-6-deoxy-D-mannose reductase
VGRWLTAELEAAGHETVAADASIDIRDAEAVSRVIDEARPTAIAHLAAVSFSPDATADPGAAFAVAVAGTANVLEAARATKERPALLVTGSSEVYGPPDPSDLPLTEGSPLLAKKPYGVSKIAQESVGLAYAARYGLRVVVTRSFNHIGPGQRTDFVVPALARRVADLASGVTDHIPVGNVDVRRDLTDVRDVVRAYRLLLEAAVAGLLPSDGLAVNVCSGESVAIRWIAEEFCRLAGVEPRLQVDPALVRDTDPPDIRGDYALLANLTGWQPRIALTDTLRDVWTSIA